MLLVVEGSKRIKLKINVKVILEDVLVEDFFGIMIKNNCLEFK